MREKSVLVAWPKILGTVYMATHVAHVTAYLKLFNMHGAIESPEVVSPYRGIHIYQPLSILIYK